MKKFVSLLSTFTIYQLLSIVLSSIAIFFLHFSILKKSIILAFMALVILMLIYIFTINRILNSTYIRNKFSAIILFIFNILYYVLFIIKWLTRPIKMPGEDDLGIGIIIASFSLYYLAIIIVSIIIIILIPKRYK